MVNTKLDYMILKNKSLSISNNKNQWKQKYLNQTKKI